MTDEFDLLPLGTDLPKVFDSEGNCCYCGRAPKSTETVGSHLRDAFLLTIRYNGLYVRRKSGYMSSYSPSTFYGTWRAGIYFRNGRHHAPFVRLGKRYVRIPGLFMLAFKPINTYTETMKGENFMRGKRPVREGGHG